MNTFKAMTTASWKTIVKLAGRFGGWVSLHSPAILLGAGIIAMAAAVVLAVICSKKMPAIIEMKSDEIDEIEELMNNEKYREERKLEGYDIHQARKEKFAAVMKFFGRSLRAFAPAILAFCLGAAALIWGYSIQASRLMMACAAYDALETKFTEYRERTQEVVGEDAENKIFFGIPVTKTEASQIKERIDAQQPDDDPEKEKLQEAYDKAQDVPVVYENGMHSQYAKYWGVEFAPTAATGYTETDNTFLYLQNEHANDMLYARGHLFLNEVYDMLGLERTVEGSVVGWVFDPNDDSLENHVDFGTTKVVNKYAVNGQDDIWLLDFNVDGVIYNKIK